MSQLTYQRGVGLVEVLVAVLLLSVAVLGFSALQMRAITATDESLVRTKSLTIVRNLAEVMRAYPEAYVTGSGATFTTVLPTIASAVPTVQAIATSTAIANADSGDSVTVDGLVISINGANNCLSTGTTTDDDDNEIPNKPCSINQLATRDTLLVKKTALEENIKVAVVSCPADATQQAIQQQMCIITAWNDTKALMDSNDDGACANSDGVYKTGSHCLISEAY
ncbi:type IV pilus modification protein PilV [Psychrobacter sp. 72-O-c]|uniref:type IV pilus modification protein PilV n=1 Tax=Psychrobacter sp. 72-O-c TaxID=2774125 RepID=UPI001D12F759|nr:type IV pilus modification protein PilV [Psychrobacter sp. 72-O-c]